MGSLVEKKIGDRCKTYHYLANDVKHALSVLLLMEPDDSLKSNRYTVATWELAIWKLRMWVAIEDLQEINIIHVTKLIQE